MPDEGSQLISEAIIESLVTATASDREDQILPAHQSTFRWVFDEGSSEFARWAQDSDASSPPLFWISGEPGSGKSTLMRYIHQSKSLRTLLRRSSFPPTILSFFFWESGNIRQRSTEGFFRSLLHQILSHQPRLLPSILPDLWETAMQASTVDRVRLLSDWPEERLRMGVLKYLRLDRRPSVYLHLDGLDELEGDQTVLVSLIHEICLLPHVKVCVSSRPWSLFTTSFAKYPSIRLQDLTTTDTTRYARDQIQKAFPWDQGSLKELAEILVSKSGGVFLWITLAVRYLVSIRPLEPLHLSHSVSLLPEGLSGLYHLMLFPDSSPSTDLSRILLLQRVRHDVAGFTRDDSTSAMTVWEMTLARMEMSHKEVVDQPIVALDPEDVEQRSRETAEDIAKYSKGLIRIQPSKDATTLAHNPITFLHRTAKDWLWDEHQWKGIVRAAADYQPHLSHLRAVVLQMKMSIGKPRRTRTISGWWPQIVLAMTHARFHSEIAAKGDDTVCALLDSLNTAMEWYYIPVRSQEAEEDHWARSCFGTLEERGRNPYEAPFIALCIKFGLATYLRYCLSNELYTVGDNGQGRVSGRSLLFSSTQYLVDRQHSVYPLASYEMVKMLLDAGLNPNHIHETGSTAKRTVKTPWDATLEALQQGFRRGWLSPNMSRRQLEEVSRTLQCFLECDADPQARVNFSHKDHTESVDELLPKLDKLERLPN